MTFIRLILATTPRWFWLGMLGFLTLLAVFLALFWAGRASEARDRALQDAKDAAATHERIDDADTGTGDGADDLDWLLQRGGR